jgi:hypothetical protein
MHSLQDAEFERDFDGQKTEHLGPLVAWVGCSLSKATSLGGVIVSKPAFARTPFANARVLLSAAPQIWRLRPPPLYA